MDGHDVYETAPQDGFRVGYVDARYDFDGRDVWLRTYVDDSVSEQLLARIMVTTRANTMVEIVPQASVSPPLVDCDGASPPPSGNCPSK
jgi:hypothetical protein